MKEANGLRYSAGGKQAPAGLQMKGFSDCNWACSENPDADLEWMFVPPDSFSLASDLTPRCQNCECI